jgi:LPS sulfotransferase NodH
MLGLGLRRRMLSWLDNNVFLRKDFHAEGSIIICGSRRSGTTWLMELLSKIPGYITLFEPFQPSWFPDSRRFNPDPNPEQEGIRDYLQNVLEGRVKCSSSLYKVNLFNMRQRLLGDKLLIKSVRANKLVGLMKSQLEAKYIIYLIRNPYAVVSSQMRTNIMPDISHMEIANESKESALASIWCDEQTIPLATNGIFKIKYEDLVLDPRRVLTPLFSALGYEDYIEDALKDIQVASKLASRPLKAINSSILEKWREELTEKQATNIYDVLSSRNFNYDEIKFM